MIVRVNDRGPFVDDRLITFYGVAVRLGLRIRAPRVLRRVYDVSGTDDWRATEPDYRRLQVGAYEQSELGCGLAVRELVGPAIPVEVSEALSSTKEQFTGCDWGRLRVTAPNNSTVSRCSYVTMDFRGNDCLELLFFELIHYAALVRL